MCLIIFINYRQAARIIYYSLTVFKFWILLSIAECSGLYSSAPPDHWHWRNVKEMFCYNKQRFVVTNIKYLDIAVRLLWDLIMLHFHSTWLLDRDSSLLLSLLTNGTTKVKAITAPCRPRTCTFTPLICIHNMVFRDEEMLPLTLHENTPMGTGIYLQLLGRVECML